MTSFECDNVTKSAEKYNNPINDTVYTGTTTFQNVKRQVSTVLFTDSENS